MRALPSLVVATFLSAAFSGCILQLVDDGAGDGIEDFTIGKKVTVTVNERTEEADRFEEVVQTRFEYRHHGADVAASALTALFTSENGSPRTEPFSRFTTAATIRRGDVIVIEAVNLTSGLIVKEGETTVAERGGIDAAWMRAGEAPLPFATSQDGVARYQLSSEAKFEFDASNFEAGGGMFVESVKGSVRGALQGTSTLRTRPDPAGPRLELESRGTPDVDVLIEGRVRQEGQTYDTGLRVFDDQGEFTGQGMLQFDSARQLTRIGFGSRQFFDLRVHMWDQDHPRSTNYEPEDITHPLIDERQAYEEEAFDDSDLELDAWAINFLTRLWSMEVGVGDEYRLHVEHKGDASSPAVNFDYLVQVAADDERLVGGRVVPTHRVSQRATLVVDPKNGGPADFDLFRSTYWISRDSHLPVHIQASHAQTFSKEKLEAFFDFMGEEGPRDLPDRANLVLTEKSTISLQEYSGNFVLSPLVGLLSANQGWMGGAMGAASAFFLLSDIGADEAQTVPNVAFSLDEANDRLVVSAASSGSDWSRLSLRLLSGGEAAAINAGSDDDGYFVNEAAIAGTGDNDVTSFGLPLSDFSTPIQAADYVELCASIPTSATVQVRDDWSNAVVAQYSFSSIGAC